MKKSIVLDANILIRAVLGEKEMRLLENHHDRVLFYAPNSCFEDAAKYLPLILVKKGVAEDLLIPVIERLKLLVAPVEDELLESQKAHAMQRLNVRDAHDWPILALALALDCAIWTEDKDFFGCGIAVWNTQNIQYFLQDD